MHVILGSADDIVLRPAAEWRQLGKIVYLGDDVFENGRLLVPRGEIIGYTGFHMATDVDGLVYDNIRVGMQFGDFWKSFRAGGKWGQSPIFSGNNTKRPFLLVLLPGTAADIPAVFRRFSCQTFQTHGVILPPGRTGVNATEREDGRRKREFRIANGEVGKGNSEFDIQYSIFETSSPAPPPPSPVHSRLST